MKSYKELLVEKITNTPPVEGNGKLLVLIDSRASFSLRTKVELQS